MYDMCLVNGYSFMVKNHFVSRNTFQQKIQGSKRLVSFFLSLKMHTSAHSQPDLEIKMQLFGMCAMCAGGVLLLVALIATFFLPSKEEEAITKKGVIVIVAAMFCPFVGIMMFLIGMHVASCSTNHSYIYMSR